MKPLKTFKEFLETASADIAQVDTKLKLDEDCSDCTPDLICEACLKESMKSKDSDDDDDDEDSKKSKD